MADSDYTSGMHAPILFTSAGPARASVRRSIVMLSASVLLHALVVGWTNQTTLTAGAPEPEVRVISAHLQPIRTVVSNTPPAGAPKPAAKAPRPAPPLAASTSPNALTAAIPQPETLSASVAAEAAPPVPEVDAPAPASTPRIDSQPATEKSAYRINLPPSVTLFYDVRQTGVNGGTLSGSGSISWRLEDQRYRIDGDANFIVFSLIDFHSVGELDANGIAPELYSEKRFRRPQTNTHFNRERNLISFSTSENNYPRLGGEQDRASIFWQITGIARGSSEKIVAGAELPIFVAGIRDGEVWPISVTGQEEQLLGEEKIQTWHLVRLPKPGTFDQRIDIWLAPALEWYPVRLRQTEANGVVLDMRMQRLKKLPSQ